MSQDPEMPRTEPGTSVEGSAPSEMGGGAAPPPGDPAAVPRKQVEDELKGRLVRLAADFENHRRRTQRELEQARETGKESLLRDLLHVLDAVDRALEYVGGAQDAFADGVRLISRQATEVLARHGVKSFESVGLPFDPTRHEAIAVEEVVQPAPGTVLLVHQRGYLHGDRLLRAAKVVVSAAVKAGGPK